MREQDTTDGGNVRPRWNRMTSITLVSDFEEAERLGISQRQFAQATGVPRTSLQFWLERKASLDANPVLVAFFESPIGLTFLHRLVGALHFVFTQVGLSGVDQVCTFLELTGLDAFVAASHGAQHAVSTAMTAGIVTFGQTQRTRLAATMPARTIPLAEDETFPEGLWLVAMEPVSGFIVMEAAAENREAATWTAAVEAATRDMPVKIAVAGGDEAAGLAAHAAQIGAHHAPDLFHVQHPLWQALVRPLIRSLEQPAAALVKAAADTAAWREHQARHEHGPRRVGRPPDFARHMADAQAIEDQARQAYDTAVAHKEGAYAAIRQIGAAYHPVDPTTGALRDADTVAKDLNAAMATLDTAAKAIDLSERRCALIDKARRVIPKMVATIAFFYAEIGRQLTQLALPQAAEEYVKTVLIPAAYLARLAGRAATVVDRNALLAVRQALLDRDEPACLAAIPLDLRCRLDRAVITCADLFVRSSSCVEGRNGRLALWHHHLHCISDNRLAALTVIHNYWIRRVDGTTAASRFFESPHDDLFDCLLDHMDLPARPASTRARPLAA